jgi:hypothetical protein
MIFKWLEKCAAKQSLFNVGINTRTLITISNRADAAIQKTGLSYPRDVKQVIKAQNSHLTDINGRVPFQPISIKPLSPRNRSHLKAPRRSGPSYLQGIVSSDLFGP